MTEPRLVASRPLEPTVGRQLAELIDLERTLGDPVDPESPMAFEKAVALDEREELPEEALAVLDRWGLCAWYVPEELGGRLSSFQTLALLLACVARRDLTAAVAHSASLLGALPVWIGGSSEQKRRVAAIVSAGEGIGFGMTERDHGSDLQATETRATPDGAGWLLHGEKWLINNAIRGRALTVFARTGRAGPRGHSLFFVDKTLLPSASWTTLPKVPTVGIRGADISGIRFSGCALGEECLLGAPGSGLELAMKSLQVSRTLVPAFSLGLLETGLRTTLSWARQRRLYGGPILEIPHVRSILAEAFLDLLICDAVVQVAARGLHVSPEQQGLRSAVVKALVPVTAENALHRLATVLGSRYFLRTGHHAGIFQKIHREIGLIGLFDGNTVINLGAVALQMPRLARTRRRAKDCEGDVGATERIRRLCDALSPPPPFEPHRLSLGMQGRDDLTAALGGVERWIEGMACTDPFPRVVRESIVSSAERLTATLAEDDALLERASGWRGDLELSQEGFLLAERYCRIQAAAACLFFWLHTRRHVGGFWADGHWVAPALARLGRRPEGSRDRSLPKATADLLVNELLRRERNDRIPNSLGSSRWSGEAEVTKEDEPS